MGGDHDSAHFPARSGGHRFVTGGLGVLSRSRGFRGLGPCLGFRPAVECSHERTGSFNSASLVAAAPVGADRAGGLESRKRLEERVPNRGSAGVGSLGGQHRCGGFSKRHNGHRSGHQPAWTDVQTSIGVPAEVARHSQGNAVREYGQASLLSR